MSEASPALTAHLMGATIDDRKLWRWINELERYTMPGCVFCEPCYRSLPCDIFLRAFRDNTPNVVCASRTPQGAYAIVASQAALEQERSIRPSDDHILRDLGVERASIAGFMEEMFARGRARIEDLFATRFNAPPGFVHRAGEQFTASFKAAVAQEAGPLFDEAQRAAAAAATGATSSTAATVAQVRRKWMLTEQPLTADAIRARFAQLVSIAHPDHGGSSQAMRELVIERDLLIASL